MKRILAACALALVVSGIPMLFPQPATAADNGLFEQMDMGFFSVGGRAAYYDPQEGQSGWFGGGQVRLHPWKFLAFEGSADYRSEDTAGSRIHTYPVQVSALIYPLGHTRLAPFLLGGGGWYYTTVKGPASMRVEVSSFSSANISRSTARIDTFGWRISSLKTRTSKTSRSTTTVI